MSYYLEVPHFVGRSILVDIPAATDSSGYDFEIEFSCQVTGTELILNGTTAASSSDILFLKASVLEYRRSGNTTISMTHGVNISQFHVYRLHFTGTGAGNIAFYVDGVFKANYAPSSSIASPAFTALLHLSSSARAGNFRYFKFTDNKNEASNRMYDARAYQVGDLILRDTAGGVNGTLSAPWLSLGPVFINDGVADPEGEDPDPDPEPSVVSNSTSLSDLITIDIKNTIISSSAFIGTVNDRLYQELLSLGCTGTINDALREYLIDQGQEE